MPIPVLSRFRRAAGPPGLRLSTGHFLDDIVSTLVPVTCPLCRRRLRAASQGFCIPCSSSFCLIRPPVCVRCGDPMPETGTPAAGPCGNCVRRSPSPGPPLPTVRSVALHTGPLRRAVLGAKYAGRMSVASSLGIFMQDRFRNCFGAGTFDLILPVPLHVTRLRQRGFNQSELLARPLAKKLDLPLDRDSVARTRHTPPQSGTGRIQRRKNLRGAFAVVHPGRFMGRSVLILDDVYTTGSTVEALAEALYTAGAANVSAFTLTRSTVVPPDVGE